MLQLNKESILSILQISMLHVEQIIAAADQILENKLLPNELRVPHNPIVGLSAAIWLGASVLDLSESYKNSCFRGESLIDFCRTTECYVDCLVVRSSNSALINEISEIVQIPVI